MAASGVRRSPTRRAYPSVKPARRSNNRAPAAAPVAKVAQPFRPAQSAQLPRGRSRYTPRMRPPRIAASVTARATTTTDPEHTMNASATNPTATATPNMTWAQALNDARALIVQQSSRIKSDAQKLRAQQDEIAQLRAALNETSAEVQRLKAME